MKRAMVTSAIGDIQPYAVPFIQNQRRYADRWQYRHILHTAKHVEFPDVSVVYSKLPFIRDLLTGGYDVVVWVDADAAFTNFSRDVASLLTGNDWLAGLRELYSSHPKYICAGLCTVWRNCPEAIAALDAVIARVKAGDLPPLVNSGRDGNEQQMLNDYLATTDYAGVHACTEDEIGSVWEEVVNPPNQRSWRRNDLAIHCSVSPWPTRAEVFTAKYAAQVVGLHNGNGQRHEIAEPAEQLMPEASSTVKLFIGIPCYHGNISIITAAALFELIPILGKNAIAYHIKLHNGEMVARARNKICSDFLDTDCTHLLFLDSDIGFKVSDVLGMLAANVHVIGGVYPKKAYDWNRVSRAAQEGTKPEDLPNQSVDYVFNSVNPRTKRPGMTNKYQFSSQMFRQCLEVSELGCGFLLIKRETLELFAKHYSELTYADDSPESYGKRITVFFDYGVWHDRYLSEDYWFCQYWRDMGGKVWAWPWAELNHAGVHVFNGKFDRQIRPVYVPADVSTQPQQQGE